MFESTENGPDRWTDFEQDFPERSTVDLVNNCMKTINPMAGIAGFHVKEIKWCSMHCSNIGILLILNGSLVSLLMERNFFGNGPEEQLHCLTTRMRTWASNNQIEHSQVYITAGMLRQDKRGCPELLGKAYNSRVLLAFLAMCMRALAGQQEDDLEASLAARVAELMAAWHHFLEVAPRYMSLEEASRLDDTSLRFVLEYKRLAVWTYVRDVRRWKLIPKLHAWRHLNKEMHQSLYNCRFFHAFLDEDAMGSAKRLAKMVHPNLLELRVLSRSLLRYKHSPRK